MLKQQLESVSQEIVVCSVVKAEREFSRVEGLKIEDWEVER